MEQHKLRSSFLYSYSASAGGLDRKFYAEIDRLGVASAKAQHLAQAITSVKKLDVSDHKIILSCITSTPSKLSCNGFIKYGVKKLFFYKDGEIREYNTLCVLDFYVEEASRRKGVGLQLFEKMMELTSTDPVKIAYDRPSVKLRQFMQKNYNLLNLDLQPNKFAIFEGFL